MTFTGNTISVTGKGLASITLMHTPIKNAFEYYGNYYGYVYVQLFFIRAKLYSRLKNFTGNTISVSGYG